MARHIKLLSLTIALALWPAAYAHAAEPQDTFSIRVSGYINEFDTTIEVDGDTREGTPINLKRDLGLDDNNIVANVGFTWRPFQRHEFGVNYFTKDSDKTRVIASSFDFDGTHYETNSTVRAAIDIDSYEAYYIWWAASHERWSLGPRVGLI